MKELVLTYQGYKNGKFCFVNNDKKSYQFSRCRSELISDFNLKENENTGKSFLVKFFVNHNSEVDVYIISDMEMVVQA